MVLLLLLFINPDNNKTIKSSLPDYGEGYSDHGY